MAKSKAKGKKRRQERARQRLEAVGASGGRPKQTGPAILNAPTNEVGKINTVSEQDRRGDPCDRPWANTRFAPTPMNAKREFPVLQHQMRDENRKIHNPVNTNDGMRPLSPMAIQIADRWAANAIDHFERIRRL